MSTPAIILISILASVGATVAFLAAAWLVIWHRMPRVRLKLQRFILSAPGGAGVFDPKIRELEQRLGKVDQALSRQSRDFDREVEVSKRAEGAMVDVMKGLTRSALRADERLKAIEREES